MGARKRRNRGHGPAGRKCISGTRAPISERSITTSCNIGGDGDGDTVMGTGSWLSLPGIRGIVILDET